MLVTQNYVLLSSCFKFFYNLLDILLIVQPKKTITPIRYFTIHGTYKKYLMNNIDLNKSVDRYIFLNMSISLFEVLIKETIMQKINDSLQSRQFKDEWLTLLMDSYPYDPLYGETIRNNKEPQDLGEYISNIFTYDSKKPLEYISKNFSLTHNYLELHKNILKIPPLFLDNIFKFYDLRNKSAHSLADYEPQEIKTIQDNFDYVIEIILGLISNSLDVRRFNVDNTDNVNLTINLNERKILIDDQILWCKNSINDLKSNHHDFKIKWHNKNYLNTKKSLIKQFKNIIIKLEVTKRNI